MAKTSAKNAMMVTVEGDLTPPPYLSPSSIGTWQQCPLKYKYSRIDLLVDPPTDATVLGNFVHETLEALHARPSDQRTLLEARAIMRELWEAKWQAEAIDVLRNDDKALHEFRWKAWWCIEAYFQLEDPSTIDLDGIETAVESSIEGVPIKGFIDRWVFNDDGTISIGDYKTGKTPRPQYLDDKFQQLYIYAHLLGEMQSTDVTQVELLYLKDPVRYPRAVSRSDLDLTAETVVTVYGEVATACANGEFAAIRHRLCDWCSYKAFCPAWV